MRPSSGPGWTYQVCSRRDAKRWETHLTPAEKEAYNALATPKRKLDWLTGRGAAKQALSPKLGLPPKKVEILSRPDGRPYCPDDAAPAFSLSHTAKGGICAVAERPKDLIGIDWEMVEKRSPRVIEFYTTPDERKGLETPEDQTLLWARKEAVLKLLGLGLNAEPTDVRFTPKLELHYVARRRWEELGSPALSLWHEFKDDSVVAVAYAAGA
jgi:phosphopantetheinyl transferase